MSKFQNSSGLLNKPIGVLNKSYDYIKNALSKNIGSNKHEFDGYGTEIGSESNPYLNGEYSPWFMIDEDKERYSNYLSYLDGIYFNGSMSPPNFNSSDKNVVDYNALIDLNSKVGSVRNYNVDNIINYGSNVGGVNPNGNNDTKLGMLNNFYLDASLYRTIKKNESDSYNSYEKPSNGAESDINNNSNSITQGAYFKFGLSGEFGLKNNGNYLVSGKVMPQSLITDDIISSSTSDSDLGRRSMTSFDDNDDEKYFNLSSFGNYYDLTYSLGLINASGGRTRELISKSIYGLDLMSDEVPSLKFDDINISNLRKITRKKYFASIGSRGSNYIDKMTNSDVEYETTANSEHEIIRLKLNEPGNDNFSTYKSYLMYAEAEGNMEAPIFMHATANEGTNITCFETYKRRDFRGKDDIISFTNEQFKNNKYKTIIGRFHTDVFNHPNESRLKKDSTSSAVSQYGMSHGRNLLKFDHRNSFTNFYHDPYCRVWTYHKQYSRYYDLIRPFVYDNKEELDNTLKNTFQINRSHLTKYGSMNSNNGLLNIVPQVLRGDKDNNIYKCMFSIENLAWKNNDELFNNTNYKKGPEGGRIMWFPPYGLTLDESISTNWNPTQFIGRGEKIYSYVDTERRGNISFTLLIDHPSLLNGISKDFDSIGDVDDVRSKEQEILRFFAGCDVLEAEKRQDMKDEVEDAVMEEEVEEIVPTTSKPSGPIEFNVYFPNNYSGVDDGYSEAIHYLCNGIGPQFNDLNCFYNGKEVGGYEMGRGGISCISSWREPMNEICSYTVDGSEYTLSAIIGRDKNGNDICWGYNVDNKYINQVLNDPNNYLDTNNNGLNSQPTSSDNSEATVYSFKEFALALGVNMIHTDDSIEDERVKTLKSILSTYKAEKIEIYGYSTSQGYKSENNTLAKNRAETIKKWIDSSSQIMKLENCFVIDTYANQNVSSKNINDYTSKINRRVRVSITLKQEDNVETNDSELSSNETTTNQNTRLRTNLPPNSNQNLLKNIAYSNINKGLNSIKRGGVMDRVVKGTIANVAKSIDRLDKLNKYFNQKREQNKIKANQVFDEYNFFKHIDTNNTVLRNKIIDKIKYFDPAYHSITPEGFNSRLTFLHQCTRQGATNSATDTNGKNIRNLSFGAPPICILRIGDFYNTKILIDSITITYDDATWDLNDEGIGVMPMMAKVTIGFYFIGGSDLSGPISRLQNAVSFNYYANTKVYDDNADKKINE